jgi:hypothetical protein
MNSTCANPSADTLSLADVASLLAVKISLRYLAEKEIGLTSPAYPFWQVNVTLFVEMVE